MRWLASVVVALLLTFGGYHYVRYFFTEPPVIGETDTVAFELPKGWDLRDAETLLCETAVVFLAKGSARQVLEPNAAAEDLLARHRSILLILEDAGQPFPVSMRLRVDTASEPVAFANGVQGAFRMEDRFGGPQGPLLFWVWEFQGPDGRYYRATARVPQADPQDQGREFFLRHKLLGSLTFKDR